MLKIVSTALATLLALASPAALAAAQTVGPPQIQRTGFNYIGIAVGNYTPKLEINLIDVGDPSGNLYVRRGEKPTLKHFDARSLNPGTTNEQVVLGPGGDTDIETGVWWVGIQGPAGLAYDIELTPVPVPSEYDGLGSRTYPESRGEPAGVSFRVWAPFAEEVNLAGSFNGWSGQNAPMASEGNGYWSLDVRNIGEGAQYQYVFRREGGEFWRQDAISKKVTNSVGNTVVFEPSEYDWTDTPYSTPSWNDMVVYEMHVGTFNDLLPEDNAVAGFAEATARLDYLSDLGVNAILLMPIHEFGGDYSWGYNPSNPWSVETAYGGPEALLDFVDQAHQRGIAVLLDVVHNHWGPSDLSLWQYDGWFESAPDKDGNIVDWGGIYFFNSALGQTPWGNTRPDFGRPEVRSYIKDNTLYWMDQYRVDGFRFDSVSNIDVGDGWSMLQWINDEIDTFQPWKINIAEDLKDNPWVTKTTGEGGAGFDTQWDVNFFRPVRDVITPPEDDFRNMWTIRDSVAYAYNGQPFQRMIYTESHDEVANGRSRVPEEIWPGNADSYWSKKRSFLGAALVLTSPGIPMLFQGQEVLEDGFFADDDPLDWTKETTFAGIKDMYRDLIRLRRDWFGETTGLKGSNVNVHHVDDFNKVVAFHRWDQGGQGDDVIVLTNFRNRTWTSGEQYRIGFPSPGTWKVRFNSDWSGYDADFDDHPAFDVNAEAIPYDGMPYSGTVSFGAYTCVILSQ